jgi:hypothetical protein
MRNCMDVPQLIQTETAIALFNHDTLTMRLQKSAQPLRQQVEVRLPNRWSRLSDRILVETATR